MSSAWRGLRWTSAWLFVVCPIAALSQQPLYRVMGGTPAVEANALLRDPAVTSGGTHLVFTSTASNLSSVFGSALNVYRYDSSTGEIVNASRNPSNGDAANGNCFLPVASADARFVVFESLATNLTPSGSGLHIFRVDLSSGSVQRVSQSQSGTQGNDQSRFPALSGDGRFVAFQSFANNLVALDSNNRADIFVKDMDSGALEVISRDASGGFADDNAGALTAQALSGDARFAVFPSLAANMVSGVAGGTQQIYLRDRSNATTVLLSQSASSMVGNSQSDQAAISANARYVVFRSFASNLVAGTSSRVFTIDRQTGQLSAVPLPLGSAVSPPLSVNATACRNARIANNGDVVMVCDMTAPTPAQAFVWRRASNQIELLSRDVASASVLGSALSGALVGISADAQTIVFESQASNLVIGDGNGVADVFYRSPTPAPSVIFRNGFEQP